MGLWARVVQPRLLDATLGASQTGEVRQRVCGGLAGDVVEVGFGTGHNLPWLPAGVTGLWAVDPSDGGFALSAARRAASPVPVLRTQAPAERLPFPDDRFDAALCTWTLCATDDPAAVLAELARVLRPGGVLHLVEHGLAEEASVVRWQRRGNGLNRRIAGCVLDRDVRGLLEASPFTVTEMSTWYEKGAPKPAGFMYEGRAVA